MGERVRIAGIVAFADRVRRELSSSTTPRRRELLRDEVSRFLSRVHQILERHDASVRNLPPPSRRALRFLQSIRWSVELEQPTLFDTIEEEHPQAPAAARDVRAVVQPARAGRIESRPALPQSAFEPAAVYTWRGIRREMEHITALLATPPLDIEAAHRHAAEASDRLEAELFGRGIHPENLTSEVHAIRGWLALMAERKRVRAYAAASERLLKAVMSVNGKRRRIAEPMRIEFRPIASIFRLKTDRRGTHFFLPTPMIAFSSRQFRDLATMAFGRSSQARQRVIQAMLEEPYQLLQRDLERLAGEIDRSAGVVHDLEASFQRVNEHYFDGQMDPPRVSWGRQVTSRKFGHYDFVGDAVVMSRTLDQATVPQFVVDYVLYHELLHKKHGLSWRNGRSYAHTGDFAKEERQFDQFRDAEAILNRLAREQR